MCLRKLVHRLSCDNRSLFATSFEGRANELFVNPFATPTRCYAPACLTDPQAPLLPVSEECPYHPCCKVSFVDLHCPQECCPDQNEKKGFLQTMASGNLLGESSHRHEILYCSHFSQFHVYIPDNSRAIEAAPPWQEAKYPYPDLLRKETTVGLYENSMFFETRKRLLSAGQRLLIAKKAHIKARREWDSVNQQGGAPAQALALSLSLYELAKAGGCAAQANFDDWKEILQWQEFRGEGSLEEIKIGHNVFSKNFP